MKLTTRCDTAAVDGCNEALLAKAAEAKLAAHDAATRGHHRGPRRCGLPDRLQPAGQGGATRRRSRPSGAGCRRRALCSPRAPPPSSLPSSDPVFPRLHCVGGFGVPGVVPGGDLRGASAPAPSRSPRTRRRSFRADRLARRPPGALDRSARGRPRRAEVVRPPDRVDAHQRISVRALIISVLEMAIPTWVTESVLVPKNTRSPGATGCPVGTRGPALNWVCAVLGISMPAAA
jgi:hypothetical protein